LRPALQVLLGYLPTAAAERSALLQRKRDDYRSFCEQLLVRPKQHKGAAGAGAAEGAAREEEDEGEGEGSTGQLHRQDVSEEDHPLTSDTRSEWNAFFKVRYALPTQTLGYLQTHA
jgi:hypothetical protein